jgi:hypothetical protein
MSSNKLKSNTYDQKKLKKLTEEQCKDYIDGYNDPNIKSITNPITGRELNKGGVISTEIHKFCMDKLSQSKSKSSSELLITKDDFLDLLFNDKKLKEITSKGKKFVYEKLMENDKYKDLIELIETKLAYFSEKINSTSKKKLVTKPLQPILNTNAQIENKLNQLSPLLMYDEIINMISSKLQEYLFERKQHETTPELENFFWAIKFILYNYQYNIINDRSSWFINVVSGPGRPTDDFRILSEYVDQILDNKTLLYPKNVGSTSVSVSDSPISGNKRWTKITEYDNDNKKKREAKLAEIEKNCIDMFDIITHEDFKEFPLEKLEQIIPLGEANKKGQKNCYYSKTLYRLYQQAVNDGKVLPKNPTTRKDLTEIEAEEIINKLKELYPTIKKPVKESKYHKNMEIWYYPCGYEGVDFTEYIIKYKYFIDPINQPTRILRISLMNFVIPSNSNRNLTLEQKSILLNAERALKMLWQDGKLISKKFPFEFRYPEFPNEYKYYLDDNNNIIWDKCLSTVNMVLTNLS